MSWIKQQGSVFRDNDFHYAMPFPVAHRGFFEEDCDLGFMGGQGLDVVRIAYPSMNVIPRFLQMV